MASEQLISSKTVSNIDVCIWCFVWTFRFLVDYNVFM